MVSLVCMLVCNCKCEKEIRLPFCIATQLNLMSKKSIFARSRCPYSVYSRGCLGVPGLLKLSGGPLKLLILSLKGVQLFKQIIN